MVTRAINPLLPKGIPPLDGLHAGASIRGAGMNISEPQAGHGIGPRSSTLFVCGFVIAAICALCGLGGGVFAVPLLHYGFRFPLKRAVATVLCLVWCVAIASTAAELLHTENALRLDVVGLLAGGVLVGTRLGYEAVKRLPVARMKVVFCGLFILMGLRLMFEAGGAPVGEGPPVPDLMGLRLGLPEALWVVAIGVAAGILVPMLGIGGGLVMVPALALALPELGFLGARAASLATAVVSSTRSLLLYRSSGLVDWRVGRAFGAGAGLGAILGVQWVHFESVARFGRSALAVILLAAAVRFGLDGLRSGAKRAISG